MTPVLKTGGITLKQCAKPGCTRHPVQRHHMGSEHMWLKHFLHKRRQKKYKMLKVRYYEFRPLDTCPLCLWHHEEISAINYRYIYRRAKRLGPCRDWPWKEAEKLMDDLRHFFAHWVKKDTPGLEPHHVVQTVSR